MRILWFDFASHSFSGVDWIRSFGTLQTPFDELQKSRHVNKVKMWFPPPSQRGGFNIYIYFLTALHESQGSKPHFVTANPDISHRDSFFEDPIHHFNLIVFAGSAGPPASLRYCATFCSWRKTVSAFVSSPLTSQLLHLSTLRSDRCISGAAHQLHQPPADLLCLLCANKATSGTYCHVK